MEQLENLTSLHRYVEIHYVVDGYCVQVCNDSGKVMQECSAPTVAEAVAMIAAHNG